MKAVTERGRRRGGQTWSHIGTVSGTDATHAPTLSRRAVLTALGGGLLSNGSLPNGTTVVWRSAEAFRRSVGVNTHFGQSQTRYASHLDKVLDALDALGVRSLREDLGSGFRIGRSAAQFERMREAAKAGFKFCLVCPDGLNGALVTPPEIAGDLFAWCDGAVDLFEGGNEPQILGVPDGAERALMAQRRLYASVRSRPDLSGVAVVGPSFVGDNWRCAPVLSDCVDFGNVHPYPGYFAPETGNAAGLDAHLKDALGIFGAAPVMATETGYHSALQSRSSHLPVPMDVKAIYLPRLLLHYFCAGIARTYLYEAVSSFPSSPDNSESAFGLVNFEWAMTPGYAAVRNLLTTMGSERARSRPDPLEITLLADTDDVAHAGFVRDDGVRLLAVWRRGDCWNAHARRVIDVPPASIILRLKGRARPVSRLDWSGEGGVAATRLRVEDRRLTAAVGACLSIFRFG